MRVHDQAVIFNVFKSLKFIDTEDCLAVSLIRDNLSNDTVGSESEHCEFENDETFEDDCNKVLTAFEQLDFKDNSNCLP